MESKPELSILERAKQRHDARTPEQIEGVKERWSDRAKWNQTLVEIQKINAKSIASQRAKGVKSPIPPIAYNEVKPLRHKLSEKAIIGRLSGGDLTKGSCSSLAMAYAGNVNGLNVKDFRGGASREFFSWSSNIWTYLKKCGGTIAKQKSGLAAANELLATMKEGKQYYFTAGRHAAIVRLKNGKMEYLELQHPTKGANGFHLLDNSILRSRFKVTRGRTTLRVSMMLDIDSLNGEYFKEVMGYINTASIKQNKGLRGVVK